MIVICHDLLISNDTVKSILRHHNLEPYKMAKLSKYAVTVQKIQNFPSCPIPQVFLFPGIQQN